MINYKQLFLVAIVVFAIDQLTKFIVTFLGYQISYNLGISLNFFSKSNGFILTSVLIILVLLLFLSFQSVWRKYQIAAGLFFGGAIANIFDRILFGSVRDWLPIPLTQIHNNIADIAIFLGLFLLIYSLLNEKKLTDKVK